MTNSFLFWCVYGYTYIQVKKGRKLRWSPTTVKLEDHVIVPEIDTETEDPHRFVEDYISNMTTTPLETSKPLWELHILNLKTSDADAICVMRIHHSLGDGASLISLLLAATRKTSDPNALPTLPILNKATTTTNTSSSRSMCWFLLAVWGMITLLWNTLVDVVYFFLTVLFIKDTHTPIKGDSGVELNTKRFVYRNLSMDDVKLIKNSMMNVVYICATLILCLISNFSFNFLKIT